MKRCNIVIVGLLMALGAVAQSHQELRDSLQKAAEVLAFHPDFVHLRLQKAAWNVELRQWEYAKDEYDRVLMLDPDNPAALYYRAYVNEKLGRVGFARQDYEHLLSVVPGHFEGQLGYALLNDKTQHKTEAMNQMNRLIELYPDSAVAYAVRGNMEKDRGYYEVALYDLSQAIVLAPDNVDYLLSRADLYLLLRRKREAQADLQRLMELGIPRPQLQDFFLRLKKK